MSLSGRLERLEQSRRPGAYPALVVNGVTVFPGSRGGGTFVIQPVVGGDQSGLAAVLQEIANGVEPNVPHDAK